MNGSMAYAPAVRMNSKLFLRDPERTELGRRIVREGALLLADIGFEAMTFRKLAERLNTKEASIYRYFENKHRLLVYLMAWHWHWLDYQVLFHTHNLTDPREQLERVLRILVPTEADVPTGFDEPDPRALRLLVIREGSKAYLTHHVTEDNREQLFKPYKDLCARIAGLITAYRPTYPYPRSRASSLIETAHYQAYFRTYLPSLTDLGPAGETDAVGGEALLTFMHHVLFSSLHAELEPPVLTG